MPCLSLSEDVEARRLKTEAGIYAFDAEAGSKMIGCPQDHRIGDTKLGRP